MLMVESTDHHDNYLPAARSVGPLNCIFAQPTSILSEEEDTLPKDAIGMLPATLRGYKH